MSPGGGDSPFGQGLWRRARGRVFHLYFLIRRPMTLGVRAVVHDEAASAVFLIRHTYVPGWHLPGGGVETGETMETALERELLEEGNIEMTAPATLKAIHFNSAASRRDHVGLYLVTAFRQPSPKRPDGEIAEAGFFSLDALPEGTTRATRERLDEVLGAKPASPHW